MAVRFSQIAALALMASFVAGGPFVQTATAQTAPAIPDTITVTGHEVIYQAHGIGAQIYECRTGTDGKLAWSFREPIATLLQDDKTVGHHYIGPSWQLADGGTITGRTSSSAPGETSSDISWLKLEVSAHQRNGQLNRATTIQRLNTKGGVASGPCPTAGAFLNVPYSADYVFLAPR